MEFIGTDNHPNKLRSLGSISPTPLRPTETWKVPAFPSPVHLRPPPWSAPLQQNSCLEGTQGSHSLGGVYFPLHRRPAQEGWDARRTNQAKHMAPWPSKGHSWATG